MNTSKTLGTLIQERKNSNGWSFRDLENRSPKGAGLNKSRWGELLRDEVKTFSGEQLRGIAEALSMPAHIVGRAALTSMGLPEGGATARTIEDVVRTDYNLNEHDRRILLAVLTAMRTENGHDERDAEDHKQEPRTKARGQEPTQPTPITRAGVSPAHENASAEADGPVVPRPDEYALAASDELSEGRALREQQDAAAEGSQNLWDSEYD